MEVHRSVAHPESFVDQNLQAEPQPKTAQEMRSERWPWVGMVILLGATH